MENNQGNINQNNFPGYVDQNFNVSSLNSAQSSEVVNVTPSDTRTVNGGINPNYSPSKPDYGFDYTFINYPARIAIYDNMKAAPRVIEIQGGPTHEYIEKIASLTYQNAKDLGGMIPYAAIREVSENFIHANFNEIVVSILDKGNTIKFCDQGPGIKNKDLVQEPGFTSATEPMKRYIRGVGSGFPLVKEYLQFSQGYIEIEDNVNQGSVVTISLIPKSQSLNIENLPKVSFNENEVTILSLLLKEEELGVTDIKNKTNIAVSTIHNTLKKLTEKELVEALPNKKRKLTQEGRIQALSL